MEKVKCCCSYNTPVKLKEDEKGGERYECYYCKLKWRYIEIYETMCFNCNEHGINLEKDRCALCKKIYNKSDHTVRKMLVLW
jgi:hypothetical protein